MDPTAREFRLSKSEFNRTRQVVKKHTGIDLSDTKYEMVYSRLAKRLRALGVDRFSDYLALVEADSNGELEEFISAITTNLTHFFREPHHFETLARDVLPAALAAKRPGNPIRIWSAGCSTGMEPYTIAMVVHETVPSYRLRDVQILASDIDRRVLASAQAGVYEQHRCRGVDPARLKQWFRRGVGSNEGLVRVSRELRRSVDFFCMNLMEQWTVVPPMDVIFCRNVLIYFDADAQRRIIEGFANLLSPSGYLFLGHSESLYRKSERFDFLHKTTFRKSR